MEQQKKGLKPQNLRTLLSISFVILVLASIGGFYFGLTSIREYAIQVNDRLADAEASGKRIKDLHKLRDKLAESTALIEKSDQIFATPTTYQSQTLNDLKRYADSARLSIANTSFSNPDEFDGIYSITLSFKQPVSYDSLITFLHGVESNLPKLQVSSIELGRAGGGGASQVKTADIKIDISVR